jgi:hypothetical protein
MKGIQNKILISQKEFNVVELERGPFSLVNNLRRYLEEMVAAPGPENRSYDRRDSLR